MSSDCLMERRSRAGGSKLFAAGSSGVRSRWRAGSARCSGRRPVVTGGRSRMASWISGASGVKFISWVTPRLGQTAAAAPPLRGPRSLRRGSFHRSGRGPVAGQREGCGLWGAPHWAAVTPSHESPLPKSGIDPTRGSRRSSSGRTVTPAMKAWRHPAPAHLMNGRSRSIGSGNTIVEFFSAATSVRVWR
jgi:hypothetical protein